MKLSYTLTPKGYKILNNGVDWIVQEEYFPYEGLTMEDKAKNHMNSILAESGEIETFSVKNPLEECAALVQKFVKENDEKMLQIAAFLTNFFPAWKAEQSYKENDLVNYKNITVRVKQNCFSSEEILPLTEEGNSFYEEISIPEN